jgi:hypothetical protein
MVQVSYGLKEIGSVGSITKLFIKEHTTPDMKKQTAIRILDEHGEEIFNAIIADVELDSILSKLKEKGFSPTKVYIDIWSKFAENIRSQWPDTQVLVDYTE